MQEWQFDLVTTATITVVLILLGYQIKHRFRFFERFCVPVAVIGGFIAALLTFSLYELDFAHIHFDNTLQVPAMVAFFTTIGLGGSFTFIRQGGKLLLIYLILCWLIVMMQDVVGAGLAHFFGIDPVFGVMAGGVSLSGGHGTGAALGSMAEGLGRVDATTVALACATFGLIAGGLLGGPVASYLIKKNKIALPQQQEGNTPTPPLHDHEGNVLLSSYQLIASAGLILVLMMLGFWVSDLFTAQFNIVLPSYVGAMFVAIIFRNLNDYFQVVKLNSAAIEVIAEISLGFFLTQAMMSLKIWDLYTLALPLTVILVIQVAVLMLVAAYIVFPLTGRNYDAAVMSSGLMGHGLGAAPTAVANMDAVCRDHKAFSYKAFLIVPLCGSVLVDIIGIPFHVWIINFLS